MLSHSSYSQRARNRIAIKFPWVRAVANVIFHTCKTHGFTAAISALVAGAIAAGALYVDGKLQLSKDLSSLGRVAQGDGNFRAAGRGHSLTEANLQDVQKV